MKTAITTATSSACGFVGFLILAVPLMAWWAPIEGVIGGAIGTAIGCGVIGFTQSAALGNHITPRDLWDDCRRLFQ